MEAEVEVEVAPLMLLSEPRGANQKSGSLRAAPRGALLLDKLAAYELLLCRMESARVSSSRRALFLKKQHQKEDKKGCVGGKMDAIRDLMLPIYSIDCPLCVAHSLAPRRALRRPQKQKLAHVRLRKSTRGKLSVSLSLCLFDWHFSARVIAPLSRAFLFFEWQL